MGSSQLYFDNSMVNVFLASGFHFLLFLCLCSACQGTYLPYLLIIFVALPRNLHLRPEAGLLPGVSLGRGRTTLREGVRVAKATAGSRPAHNRL